MAAKSVLGKNDIEDVRWLCSLTESELDLLMGMKSIVNMRAQKVGHGALAKKFDLKMLRTLSFIFMEHLKEQLQDVQPASGFDSNLLKQNLSDSFASMSIEDLHPFICSDKKKRIADMFFQGMRLPKAENHKVRLASTSSRSEEPYQHHHQFPSPVAFSNLYTWS